MACFLRKSPPFASRGVQRSHGRPLRRVSVRVSTLGERARRHVHLMHTGRRAPVDSRLSTAGARSSVRNRMARRCPAVPCPQASPASRACRQRSSASRGWTARRRLEQPDVARLHEFPADVVRVLVGDRGGDAFEDRTRLDAPELALVALAVDAQHRPAVAPGLARSILPQPADRAAHVGGEDVQLAVVLADPDGAGPRRVLQCSSMVTMSLVKLQSGSGPVCSSPDTRGAAREHEVRAVRKALLRGSGEDRGDRDQQEATDDYVVRDRPRAGRNRGPR